MDQLFLLEILIERIEFFAYVKNVPQKKQINVFVGFGNIAQLEIRSETPGEASEGKSKRNIEYNAGKSYLFPCGTATMIDALQTCPLEISVYDKGTSEPVGTTTLQWDRDFVDMVESSEESAGFYVTPMSIRQTLKFSSKTELVGEFVLFVRLSCFGKNIQTSVQVTQAKEGGRMYLFKDSNAATTFQCQKYGMMGTSSDTIPVAPLYNLVTGLRNLRAQGAGPQALDEMDTGEKESWFQLFDDATMSLMSLRPTEFKAVDIAESIVSSVSQISDVFALTGRMQENKYFDFLKQLLMKPLEDQEELVISSKGGLSPTSVLSDGKSASNSGKGGGETDCAAADKPKEEELTAERIGRLLCKNSDCPGALKFKEFGIGPLATGRGLGTVYDVTTTTPPATYGMSQTYGVLDDYGAYGVFSRPKRPDEPFVPAPHGSATAHAGKCKHRICEKHRKALQEGRIKLPHKCVNINSQHAESPQCRATEQPLRIKGGSDYSEYVDQNDSTNEHDQENLNETLDEIVSKNETNDPNDECVADEMEYFGYKLKDKASNKRKWMGTPVAVNQCWVTPLRLRGGGQHTPEIACKPTVSLRKLGVVANKYRHTVCHKRSRILIDDKIKNRSMNPNWHTLTHTRHDTQEKLIAKDSLACNTRNYKESVAKDPVKETKRKDIEDGVLGHESDDNKDDFEANEFKYFRYIFTSKSSDGGEKKPLRMSECWAMPMRLRAGGRLTMEELSRPKSPLLECRVIMEQFDSILQEYKKALGPCGQASCPYSPNLMEKPCLKECNEFDTQNVDLISCIDIDCPLLPQLGVLTKDPPHKDDSLSNCGAFNCPFKNHSSSQQQPQTPQIKFKHLTNACGSLRCPYTKYKTGLVDEDAAMELQYLPPAISGKCGHPKCAHPVEMDLPPIHWDCPEPLPKGPCKNPDCPFLPPDLRCLKVLAPKGPCGSPTCPYVTPQACTSPQCPFRPRPCPYMADPTMAPAGDYSRDSDSCGDPDCPFDKRRRCIHPSCASSKQDKSSRPTREDTENTVHHEDTDGRELDEQHCSAPPRQSSMNNAFQTSTLNAKDISDVKVTGGTGSPRCCWKGDSESDCDDPDCPFGRKPAKPCGNPNCPYSKLQESSECTDSDCPFNKQRQQQQQQQQQMVVQCPPPPDCGVPDCPYAVPSPCPYERPICPYNTPIVCPALVPPCMRPPPCMSPQLCQMCLSPLAHLAPPTGDNLPTWAGLPTQGDGIQISSTQEGTEQITSIQGGGQDGGDGGGDRPTETAMGDRPEGGLDLEPCRQGTCKSTGGTLVCEECPCDEGVCASEGQIPDKNKKPTKKEKKTVSDPGLSKRKKINLKKLVNNKKWKSKYVYSVGDKYPGIQVGHRECVMPGFNVPPNMGWLWNIHTPCMSLKPRRGWRPGAVCRTIAKRIHDHRVAKGQAMQHLPDFSTGKKKKKHHGIYESDSDSTVAPKPTLLIKKEKGTYFITMNPLKDPNTLADNENPYMDCTPMQFRITKNKKPRMRQDEEDFEYRTCYCEDEDDQTPSTSSSDSELDIEFTPPAGIIRPDRLRKKKNVVHCESQYDPEDCKPPPAKCKKDKKDKGKKGKGKGKGKGAKKGGKGKKKK